MYIAINLPQKTKYINKLYTNNLADSHKNIHLNSILLKQVLLPKQDWKENKALNSEVTQNMIDIYY